MITMLLGGLWHGAGWTFVVWGALHGSYLVIHQAYQKVTKDVAWAQTRWMAGAGWCLTFLAVVVGWVFFRAHSFTQAGMMLKGMAGLNGLDLPLALQGILGHLGVLSTTLFDLSPKVSYIDRFLWLAGAAAIAFFAPNTDELFRLAERYTDRSEGKAVTRIWRPSPAWAMAIGCLLATAVLSLSHLSEFLYFKF
jgi:hypothetical protein